MGDGFFKKIFRVEVETVFSFDGVKSDMHFLEKFHVGQF